MTQQLQDEFDSSVENAEAWMKAIQERLRINDNTKGPRSALEARLRETEVRKEWCSSSAVAATTLLLPQLLIWVVEFSIRKLSASPACKNIGPVWMHLPQYSFSFYHLQIFTNAAEKEDGNLMSQASKLFKLISKTSSRFGRLKCLQSPMSMFSLQQLSHCLQLPYSDLQKCSI